MGRGEKVARAMVENFWKSGWENAVHTPWEDLTKAQQNIAYFLAGVAMGAHEGALADEGLFIAPREPTADMGQAGYAAWDKFGEDAVMGPAELIAIWQAMAAAAVPWGHG